MERRKTHQKKNSEMKNKKSDEGLDHEHSHKRRSSDQTKIKNKSEHNRKRKSSSIKEVEYSDIILMIGKYFAEDFWETAWDICETRFDNKYASQLVAFDLRDTWLSIIGMQCLDTDSAIQEGIKLPDFAFEDCPPLPPKFDFWSHGTLELLPRTCRESVMDPFLREPLPWFMEEFQDLELPSAANFSDMQISNETLVLPHEENSNMAGREKESNALHLHATTTTGIIRPTSPIPSEEYSVGEWSLASTGGSLSNLKLDKNDFDSGFHMLSYPTSASSLAAALRKESAVSKSPSIEFLYPSKLPVPDITASSEFAYNLGKGGTSGAKRSESSSKTGSQLFAFKLPRQTSSESIKAHAQRKLSMKKSTSTTTSNQQDE